MQEILLEDQLRSQLHIQDPTVVLAQQAQQQVQRQNRPRRVKKAPPKSEQSIEETINSLKNEIEYMPMKTPISILQELLSRRGNHSICAKKYRFLTSSLFDLFFFVANSKFFEGITPNYELVQIEGAVHEPSFRYRVSFNDKDGKIILSH